MRLAWLALVCAVAGGCGGGSHSPADQVCSARLSGALTASFRSCSVAPGATGLTATALTAALTGTWENPTNGSVLLFTLTADAPDAQGVVLDGYQVVTVPLAVAPDGTVHAAFWKGSAVDGAGTRYESLHQPFVGPTFYPTPAYGNPAVRIVAVRPAGTLPDGTPAFDVQGSLDADLLEVDASNALVPGGRIVHLAATF